MLTEEDLSGYLASCTTDQISSITATRGLICELCPNLVEVIDEGKWFGGLLTYSTAEGIFVYALGPRAGGFTTFHMMPFYGSAALKDRHGDSLKRFLTGKSCIKFKRFDELPADAIRDILGSTPKFIQVATEMMTKRKAKLGEPG